MNDEFLYRLRVQPPATFAARLKARLEIEAAVATAKRRTLRLVMFCGIFFGAAAIALVTPSVRTEIVSWVGQFGSAHEFQAPPRTLRADSSAQESNVAHAIRSGASTPSGAPDQSSAPQASNDSVAPTGPGSTSGLSDVQSPRPRLIVKVTNIQAPVEIIDDVSESFRKAYGYEVRSRDAAEGESICTRWAAPDAIVTLGRMSDTVQANCDQAGFRFMDVPLGYEVYIAVVNSENTWANTLTVEELQTAAEHLPWDPLTTWNQLRPSWPSLPIALFGIDSAERSSTPRFAPSRQGRSLPISVKRDDANVPRSVAATYGGLGFMRLATYASQTKASGSVPVKVLAIVNAQGDAVLPSQKTIQDERYDTLSRPVMLYLNVDHLVSPWVSLFGTHAVETAAQRVGEHGFMPVDKLSVDTAVRKIRTARGSR